jgi:hypothetical protein
VSLPEIAGLLWRHVLAVLAVLVLATGVAYTFRHTAPTYAESATLVFLPPISGAKPNPFSSVGGSLTEAAATVAIDAMSPLGQQQVRQAGGTAGVDVELLNSYNLEYPNFSNPYLTVTTSSADPSSANQTFNVVTKLLISQFTAQEMRDNVAPNNRIHIVLAGDTGPLRQQGSSKRALAALLILTIVAVFAVASFLDRHPVRLGRLPGIRLAGSRPARVRLPGIRKADPAGPDY